MESHPSGTIPQAQVETLQWEDLLKANASADVPPSALDDPTTAAYPAGGGEVPPEEDSLSLVRRGVADALRTGLGSEGVGLVAIRGVPGFAEAKRALFSQAHALVRLPAEYLEEQLSDPGSLYNAGWSHGKERLGANKPPDTAKASFYYNPLTDQPGTERDRKQYPLSYPSNKWPDADLLPEFRVAAVELGQLLHRVVVQVARQVDALAARDDSDDRGENPRSYPDGYLYCHMKDTDKVKARLLYYYPLIARAGASGTEIEEVPTPMAADDSWIGWHNDSGFFTALAGDWYLDHATGRVVTDPSLLDPSAGLYVESRSGRVLKVSLPDDCVAVQLGECTQIVTGGIVRATPHCVRGSAAIPDLARVSLACFVDVRPSVPLSVPDGCLVEQVLSPSYTAPLTPRVPPLQDRWTNGMSFGDFLQKTFIKYYEWNDEKDGGISKNQESS